jgi:transmembrane sensor
MAANDDIILIIAKEAGNQASAAELQQLQQWLALDVANQQEYDELVMILLASSRALQQPAFNSDTAWQQFAGKMQSATSGTSQPAGRVRPLFSIKRLALAVAVIAVIATGWYLWQTHEPVQTFTATATNQHLTLPDGSTVMLRKGSSLQYTPKFNKEERLVHLNGEAFFTVQPNDHQPFLIATSNSSIKVTGTTFLVNAAAATDEVVVVTGRVLVTGKSRSGNTVQLAAGERVVVKHDRLEQTPVTDSNFLAWQTGVLDFKQSPLQKVLEDISHYYNIPVELAGNLPKASSTPLVTVRFYQQPLEQVLDEIRLITGLHTKKEAGKVVLYRE